ncbi:MAG: DNA mismatch repair protein MutS, partial [Roseiflexaceae bacterium]
MNLDQQLRTEFPTYTLHKWYVQFRELKATQPDAVLFYRLGDFYEAFDDDAKLVAELMDVTLTYKEFASDKQGGKHRCPMAGMPYHAVESYVNKLVAAGYRVAIAEQISETASSKSDTRPRSVFAGGIAQTSSAKGMVERQIVRIVTPGTVVDGTFLNAATNNYIVALINERGGVGLAYADLSTGEFACCELHGALAHQHAHGELARLQAAEVLVSDDTNQRIAGIDPRNAGLQSDLEFMTKEERDMLLPHERVARRVERESAARWANGHITALPGWRWEARTAA